MKEANKIEPKFDEYRAYEELRMIFAIAIETQDFTNLEAAISAWKHKYPIDEFIDVEIIRKIKYILSQEYLSTLLDINLANRISRNKQKQEKALSSLKEIIETAEKTKDYKTAQKEIDKWKINLKAQDLTLYSFDSYTRKKMCSLLLVPGNKIKDEQNALNDLKNLKIQGEKLDSKTYSEEISNWQNKYCVKNFSDKLQQELNSITSDVMKSISDKRTEENALEELKKYETSDTSTVNTDELTSILSKYDYKNFSNSTQDYINKLTYKSFSLPQTEPSTDESKTNLNVASGTTQLQFEAINNLKEILNNNSHDLSGILNWIYLNRKINFSDFSRSEIIKIFASSGYKIPKQSTFYIPEINANLDFQNSNEINLMRKNIVLNYLGILSVGNKLSDFDKDNLDTAVSTSNIVNSKKKADIVFNAYDNDIDVSITAQTEKNDKFETDANKELANNSKTSLEINIEDLLEDPMETYSIKDTDNQEKPIEIVKEFKFPKENETDEIQEEFSVSSNNNDDMQENDLDLSNKDDEIQEEISILNNNDDEMQENDLDLSNKDNEEHEEALTQTDKNDTLQEEFLYNANEKEFTATINVSDKEDSLANEVDSPYSLTEDDQKNIEIANNISMFAVVSIPWLPKLMVSQNQKSKNDFYIEKNNGS